MIKQSVIMAEVSNFKPYQLAANGVFYNSDEKLGGIELTPRAMRFAFEILMPLNDAYNFGYYHGFNAGVKAREKLMEKE